ncbi:unnamed protein product [Hermetia illucens]|uniref:Uncharacterized protein n=1 Tax=Hermetia illucens TaxID=343691 RepID=A0A7R8UJI4_HERIL|nr:uncharacterized protein LOC119648367 [Hermetia illucens]CAD7082025.1 unnamed protein product [Hermetia illucens]
MKTAFVILFLCGYLHDVLAKTPAQALLDSVGEEDKNLFIKYHLSLAINKYGNRSTPICLTKDAKIPESKQKLFRAKGIQAPKDFHQNLYNWVRADLQVPEPMMAEVVTSSVVCFPDINLCFDPNDIGSVCCPF